jgi:hypothetical protein
VDLQLTFAVLAAFAAWYAWQAARTGLGLGQMRRMPAVLCMIAAPGIAFAAYYFALFDHGVWSVFKQSSQESALEALLDWGFLLPAAVWAWCLASRDLRPLRALLGLWCVIAIGGWALNLYQGTRLTNGITIPIGGLIGLAALELSPLARRRIFAAVSASLVCQYLFLLTSLLQGNSAPLYNSAAEERALHWLAQNGTPNDVVLAPFRFGNVIPERSTVHVVAGHGDQTYDLDIRGPELATFFGARSTVAQRLQVLRETGATLVAYDGSDLDEGPFDPRGLPGLRVVFAGGNVAILRVHLDR